MCGEASGLELVFEGEGSAEYFGTVNYLRFTLLCAGRILQDNAILNSVSEGFIITAVVLASGQPPFSKLTPILQSESRVRIDGLQTKPQYNGRTGAICGGFDHESGRWTVAVDASDAGPAFHISIRPANLRLLPAINIDAPQRPSAPSTSSNTLNPTAQALQQGSRVRIEGLQAKPQFNGRMGVVCAFNQETGRWTVDLGADGAKPACRGMFRSANLRLIAPHNFSTEWVDEGGRVWPKKVIFSRQCAKGHALSPFGRLRLRHVSFGSRFIAFLQLVQ
jgi:hypothetical protein